MSTKENKGTSVPSAKSAQKNVTEVTVTEAAKVGGEKSITDLQKELAERLKELNYKKKLADHREIFLQTDANLKEFQKDLTAQCKAGAFEAQTARITFKGRGKDNYRDEDIFSISNVGLIVKFIDFLRQEIKTKINEIETELIY
ncbi:MAG: hypothetical protein LBS69_07860 [Prevotellaceae bacterium]|jgi:hypothetical protein|nr:hypothetical protein [Prevotellaceae bacterium]